MSRKILLSVLALGVAFLSFTASAFAASSVSPDDAAPLDLLRPVIEAVKNGEFALAGALGVIFMVAMTRRYLPDRFGGKYVRSDLGGMLTAFLYAAAGSIATTFADPSAAFTGSVALAALKFGMGAIGGFVALHKLATALTATKWWNEKAPAWLRSSLALVLALIGSSAASKAKAAGEAAVRANPAPATNPTLGEPTDV